MVYAPAMALGASHRILLNLALDALLAAVALPLALVLAAPGPLPPGLWPGVAINAALVLLAGAAFGLPRQYWRYIGASDLMAVAGAAVVACAIFAAGAAGFQAALSPNPFFMATHVLVLTGLMAGARAIARLRHSQPQAAGAPTALVIGTGDAADLFLRALARQRPPEYRVLGILARHARQSGRRIQGQEILGTVEEAEPVIERLRATGRVPSILVLSDPEVQGAALETLLDVADRQGITLRRAPRPTALDPATRTAEEDSRRIDLKPIAIEDLLDRPQLPLDRIGMARLVQGRRVLITGAGGTIGGELARQVAALGPSMLTLLDHGEYALYQIDLELAETHPNVARRAVLADVRDAARLARLFADTRPDLVFHAAALKHVPMVENDPLEGLLTNAQGTRMVADAARAAGCRVMVFISTDKAVNPTSVMGASKRLAEMYCQGLDVAARQTGQGMRCVTVRFGNVLGSTGSVVPLFRRQLERGGPLTVTHPDMQRYFMTVREAVGLVLQASVVGAEDAEDRPPELRDGGIFVLDMGQAVKIVDLARRMIRLAGLRPDDDVEIRFTGLRPGEKLFEEMFHGAEPPRPTRFPGLLVATPRTADPALIGRAIDEVAAAARAGQGVAALAHLGRLVPEFDHNADGVAPHG